MAAQNQACKDRCRNERLAASSQATSQFSEAADSDDLNISLQGSQWLSDIPGADLAPYQGTRGKKIHVFAAQDIRTLVKERLPEEKSRSPKKERQAQQEPNKYTGLADTNPTSS